MEQINGNPLQEDYFTAAQLATILKKSTRTLDRWHIRKIGPPRTQVARLILYRKTSVMQWLQANEQKQPRRRTQ
jgi:hypothetical protein